MKYLKKFNEGMTEDEYNGILDKISEFGLSSLTPEEKFKLDNFDGTFDKDRNNDVIITTDHGTWTSNDINPKYLSDNKDKGSVYDDSKKNSPEKKSSSSDKSKPSNPVKYANLYSEIVAKWDNGNGYELLHKDEEIIVILEKYVIKTCYVFYIVFKKIDFDNKCKVLKLSYDLRSNHRDMSGISIFDNNSRPIDFNNLETVLNQNNLSFGDFNNAWYYIEDRYNNR